MPKSKRNRVVHLTKTKPKGMTRKSELVDTVQGACDEYKCIYVFSCENLRSDPLKRLRSELKDCRFVFGKNKVIQLALGKSKEEAYLPGLEKLAEVLKGEVGLVFTNQKPSEFESMMQSFKESDYARAGFTAPQDIIVKGGPIEGQPSSMFEPLRKLLLPVRLNKGVIELEEDFYVCRKGDVLTPEQAQALKFFDFKLAEFTINLEFRWRDGELTQLKAPRSKLQEKQQASMEDVEEDGNDSEEEVLEEKKKTKKSAKKKPAKKTKGKKAAQAMEEDSDDDF